MAKRSPRPEEAEAAKVFTSVTGIPLRFADDGARDSSVDYTYDTSSPDGVLEVTSFTDRIGRQNSVEWSKSQKEVYVHPGLVSSWLLSVDERSRFKDLAAHCGPALLELERAGITVFTTDVHWDVPPGPLADSIQMLIDSGVGDAEIITTSPPLGQIHVSSTGASWASPDPEDALATLEAYLAAADTADVRRKLAVTGFAERHAFVWVDYFNRLDAAWPIANAGLPHRPPELPPEITHVWFALRQGDGWHWSPKSGWQRIRFTPTRA